MKALIYGVGSPKGIRTPAAAVRGRCPEPLDDRAILAGEEGLEPSLPGPEPGVLPLDDSPKTFSILAWNCLTVKDKILFPARLQLLHQLFYPIGGKKARPVKKS